MANDSLTLLLVGGPTALISYGGLRILTDPTFDPPGEHPRPGTNVMLRKLQGPAVSAEELPEIDAVLLSHDHHADNLDVSGRAFLPRARRVLSTDAGAERLGGGAIGMTAGDAVTLERPNGGVVTVSAVPAEHGPPDVAAKNGPVTGFVLRGEGLPTLYVSGDNASVDVVRAVASEHGPISVAVLFLGGAQVPAAWGEAFLTLTAATAVEAARVLDPAVIVPIHQDGWEHFSSHAGDVRGAFAAAGLSDRLRSPEPGQTVFLA